MNYDRREFLLALGTTAGMVATEAKSMAANAPYLAAARTFLETMI